VFLVLFYEYIPLRNSGRHCHPHNCSCIQTTPFFVLEGHKSWEAQFAEIRRRIKFCSYMLHKFTEFTRIFAFFFHFFSSCYRAVTFFRNYFSSFRGPSGSGPGLLVWETLHALSYWRYVSSGNIPFGIKSQLYSWNSEINSENLNMKSYVVFWRSRTFQDNFEGFKTNYPPTTSFKMASLGEMYGASRSS